MIQRKETKTLTSRKWKRSDDLYVNDFLALEDPFRRHKNRRPKFLKSFKKLKKNSGQEILTPSKEKTKSPLRVLILYEQDLKR